MTCAKHSRRGWEPEEVIFHWYLKFKEQGHLQSPMPFVCAKESRGGGKGALIQEDMSGTLGCGNDQTIFCLQGAMVGRADTAGPGGKGWRSDGAAYTVDTKAPSVICVATQQGGAEIAIDLCPTITQATGTSGNNQPVVCLLNDHGGGGTKSRKGGRVPYPPSGSTPTRAGGVACAGFVYKQGAKAGSVGFEEEVAPTLRAGLVGGAAVMIERAYGVDCRNGDVNQDVNGTLQAKPGGGG